MDLKEERMRTLNQVEPSIYNIWFYWDGPCEGDRRQQLYDAVFSTRGYNPTRPIFLVSNTWQQEPVLTDRDIEVIRWDDTIYDLFPNGDQWRPLYNAASARDRCDLLRFLFLKGWGGSYIDSDDMAIRPIPEPSRRTKNQVCRSYDPHTCHYDGNTPEMCLPGHLRDKPEFDHIPIFPRTDVWLNHEPHSKIVTHLLDRPEHRPDLGINTIYSYGQNQQVSWQTMILRTCQDLIGLHRKEWNLEMTLLYLFESHVANCSYWDQGRYGGEMHQIWPVAHPYNYQPPIIPDSTQLDHDTDKYAPNPDWTNMGGGQTEQPWGEQRFTKEQFRHFRLLALNQFRGATHLWLHDKEPHISPEWNARHKTMNHRYNLLSTYWIEETRKLYNIPHV